MQFKIHNLYFNETAAKQRLAQLRARCDSFYYSRLLASLIVLHFCFHLVYLCGLKHTCSMIKDKAEALKNLHTTSGMRFPQRTSASGNSCRRGVERAMARAKVLSNWLLAVFSERKLGFAGTTNSWCTIQLCAHCWRINGGSFELVNTVVV